MATVQFSHAPTYIHPLGSIPGILSLLLIFSFFTLGRRAIKNSTQDSFFYVVMTFIPISVLFTVIVSSGWNEKYLPYMLAHLWFLVLLYVIYATPKNFQLNIHSLNIALIVGVSISCFYAFFEAFLPYLNIDVGSLIPRYDRQDYKYWTPYAFFRTRAFNYESANFAMLINVYYSLIYYVNNKLIDKNIYLLVLFFLAWSVSLLFTFSAFQIFLFFLFVVFYFFTRSKKALLYIPILLFIAAFFLGDSSFALFDNIQIRMTGETESSNVRAYLFDEGIKDFYASPIFGHGYAGFLSTVGSGYNNFYLQLLTQVGVLAILFYTIIFILFARALKTKNIYLIFSFIFAWGHLFFIGDFWLGQVLIPILFIEYHNRNSC